MDPIPTAKPSPADASASDIALTLLASPSIASKRWALSSTTRSSDRAPPTGPVPPTPPSSTFPESGRAIAVAIDGPATGRLRPYQGQRSKPRSMRGQPRRGRGRAARRHQLPLNFGNRRSRPSPGSSVARSTAWRGLPRARGARGRRQRLALQRDSAGNPIYPTPVVGMVGELPDASRVAGEPGARVMRSPWSARSTPRWPVPSSRSSAASSARPAGVRDRPGKGRRSNWSEAVRSGSIRTATDVSDGGIATAQPPDGDRLRSRLRRPPDRIARQARLFGGGCPLRRGPGNFILAGEEAGLEKRWPRRRDRR